MLHTRRAPVRLFMWESTILALLLAAAVLAGCGGGGGASATPAQQSLPTGRSTTASTSSTETARTAQSFVDSIGMNVHLSYYGTPYADDFSQVASLLSALHLHHLRDTIVIGQTNICQEDQQLAASGMRFDFIAQPGTQPSDLVAWASCVGSALESYEPPNEYDMNHPSTDANWPATLQTFQKMLYASVKSSLPNVQVVGPALTSWTAYSSVGDLSAYIDVGNMHDYFAGYDPGTGGWGGGGYGSIPWNLSQASLVAGTKPVEATETGYDIAPAQSGISLLAEEKYVPRLFLEQFNAGVPRTYEYELIDEGGSTFNSYGLVTNAMTPKPAYNALRSVTSLLNDPGGTAFTPGSLSYTMSGNLANVHHTLLEKQDGSFFLAIWIETMSYDPNAQADISVPSQSISLQVGGQLSSVTLYTIANDGTMQTTPLAATSPISLTATDSVSFLKLVPSSN